MSRKNIAIILAGGKGNRFSLEKPKQLINIFNKPLIQYSIEAFNKINSIDDIYIGCNLLYKNKIEKIIKKIKPLKRIKTFESGVERIDTCNLAIKLLKKENIKNTNIIFHDAARPIINDNLIDLFIAKLNEFRAVHFYSKSRDILFEIENTNQDLIKRVFNNRQIVIGQTPQGFHLDLLQKVFELFEKDLNAISMENTELIQKYLPNEKIALIEGSLYNLKMTYSDDIFLIKNILKNCQINLKY